MPRTQFEGRSAAEAAIKACEQLGLTRADIRYEVVSETGEGIDRRVTIAVDAEARPAAVSTELREPAREREPSRDREPRRDEGRGRDRDRGGRTGRDRGERSARGPGGDRGPRRGDRDRGDRGGDRDRGRRLGRGGRGHEPEADGIEPLLKLEDFPATAAPRAELTGQVSERATQAKTVLNEVLKRMGFKAAGAVVQDDAQEIHLDISGDDARRIIGKKGEPLLSLQFLVNRMVSRGEEGDQVVVLDVAGYRERRRAALADLAKRLAARALEEHKVVKLSPMSAHDRRVFHLTLTEIEGVTTQSEGEGLLRRLLIIPSEFAGPAD